MRWFVAVIGVLVLGAFAVVTLVPYLPQLLLEGSPSFVWSENGYYADVTGASEPMELGYPADRPLEERLEALFRNSGGTALLAAHRRQLALEHYAADSTAETRHDSFSIVKSLVGALVFKAVAEGRIGSFDQTLGELLPEASGLKNLSLRRLLTMRAGVHFDSRTTSFGGPGSMKDNDTFPNPFGPLARLHFQGLEVIDAGLTMDQTPSDELNYQNVNTALLGAVLERAYGEPLEQLLSEKIWTPAGAATAVWRRPQPGASVSAYCCLYATARDWIRIGMFLESNGTPADPFLPDALWREFLGIDVSLEDRRNDHYGNHALQNVLDRPGEDLQGPFTYFVGQNGQVLYIMPNEDLVVYRAGERYQLLHSTLYGAWNSIKAAQNP